MANTESKKKRKKAFDESKDIYDTMKQYQNRDFRHG